SLAVGDPPPTSFRGRRLPAFVGGPLRAPPIGGGPPSLVRVGSARCRAGSPPRRPRLNEPLRDLHPNCRRAALARTPFGGIFTPWTKAASLNVRSVLVAPPRLVNEVTTHRIEHRDYSAGRKLRASSASDFLAKQDYSDEPPSTRTSPSRGIRLYAVGINAGGKPAQAHIDGESRYAGDAASSVTSVTLRVTDIVGRPEAVRCREASCLAAGF